MQLKPEDFADVEVSNIIWATGSMGIRSHLHVMRAFADEMLRRGLDSFIPQAIANVSWGFASIDLKLPRFMQASLLDLLCMILYCKWVF